MLYDKVNVTKIKDDKSGKYLTEIKLIIIKKQNSTHWLDKEGNPVEHCLKCSLKQLAKERLKLTNKHIKTKASLLAKKWTLPYT